MSTYAQNQPPSGSSERSNAPDTSNGGETPNDYQLHNSNRWSTKQLVVMALMCAVAILLSFIEFPLFPTASFLKLDISLVPCLIVGFAFGWGPGLLVGVVCAIAHGAITGNWVGALMCCIVAVAYLVPASAIYQHNRTMKGAIIGLVTATICLIVGVSLANLVIDPLFYGMPFEAVAALILPAIVPFNIIKGILISVLAVLIYKSISNMITPEKNRVQGR